MIRFDILTSCTGAKTPAPAALNWRASSASTRPRGTSVLLDSEGVISAAARVVISEGPPVPAVGLDEAVGLARPPGPRLVLGQEPDPALLPVVEDRHDELPGRLHGVPAHEQRGVAGHHVEEQPLVSLGRRAAEAGPV